MIEEESHVENEKNGYTENVKCDFFRKHQRHSFRKSDNGSKNQKSVPKKETLLKVNFKLEIKQWFY